MVTTTIYSVLVLIIYIAFIEVIFRLIYKARKSVSIKFAKSLLLIIGITVIVYVYLNQFEFSKDISKTLLQSGSFIVAIATFSCQQVLTNVMSGILLSIAKPFDVNDKIQLISQSGSLVLEATVKNMNARHVVLEKADGKVVYITNNMIDSYIVENCNVLDENGRIFSIECTYDSDVDTAIQLVAQAIKECPFTINKDISKCPSAKIRCSKLSPNGYEIKTCIWAKDLNDSFDAFDYLNREIPKLWAANNVNIPYTTIQLKH